jgi:uncharacterized protein YjbI with pentapeptide repeats
MIKFALSAWTGAALILTAALVFTCVDATTAVAAPINAAPQLGGVCADCDFSSQNLSAAPVTGNFPRTRFEATRLTEAELSGNFSHNNFVSAELTRAIIHSSNLSFSDFTASRMDGLSADRSNFSYTVFDRAKASNARFMRSTFSHASLVGFVADNAQFHYVNAEHSNFSESQLVSAVFMGSILDHARFDNANLSEASFRGATLRHVSFREAQLKGTRFDGAVLEHADFSQARGLNAESFVSACGDAQTSVPANVVRPKPCSGSGQSSSYAFVHSGSKTHVILHRDSLRAALSEARAEAAAARAAALADLSFDGTIQEALAAAVSRLSMMGNEDNIRIIMGPSKEPAAPQTPPPPGMLVRAGSPPLLSVGPGVKPVSPLSSSRATTREIEALRRALAASSDPVMRDAFARRLAEISAAEAVPSSGGISGND